jgi:hypothetical protein
VEIDFTIKLTFTTEVQQIVQSYVSKDWMIDAILAANDVLSNHQKFTSGLGYGLQVGTNVYIAKNVMLFNLNRNAAGKFTKPAWSAGAKALGKANVALTVAEMAATVSEMAVLSEINENFDEMFKDFAGKKTVTWKDYFVDEETETMTGTLRIEGMGWIPLTFSGDCLVERDSRRRRLKGGR